VRLLLDIENVINSSDVINMKKVKNAESMVSQV